MGLTPVVTPVERALRQEAKKDQAQRNVVPVSPRPTPMPRPTPRPVSLLPPASRPTPNYGEAYPQYPRPSPVPVARPAPTPPWRPGPVPRVIPQPALVEGMTPVLRVAGRVAKGFVEPVARAFLPESVERKLGIGPAPPPPRVRYDAKGRVLPPFFGMTSFEDFLNDLEIVGTAMPATAEGVAIVQAALREAIPQAQLAAKAGQRGAKIGLEEIIKTPAVREKLLKAALPLRFEEGLIKPTQKEIRQLAEVMAKANMPSDQEARILRAVKDADLGEADELIFSSPEPVSDWLGKYFGKVQAKAVELGGPPLRRLAQARVKVPPAAPALEGLPAAARRPLKIRYHAIEMIEVGKKFIVRDRTAIGATAQGRTYTTESGAKLAFDNLTKSEAKVLKLTDWESADSLIAKQRQAEVPPAAKPPGPIAPEAARAAEVPPGLGRLLTAEELALRDRLRKTTAALPEEVKRPSPVPARQRQTKAQRAEARRLEEELGFRQEQLPLAAARPLPEAAQPIVQAPIAPAPREAMGAKVAVPPVEPPKPPVPPVAAGVPPQIPEKPTIPTGIQGDLRLATEMVKQNQPGLPGKIADIIPGVRQIGRFFAPGKAMPENMRTAWVAKTGTASRLSTDFSSSRLPLLEKVDATFGKGAAEGERVAVRFLGSGLEAKSPLTGTILDIAQNPDLYELNAAQRAFLEQAQARNLANLGMTNTRYATDIGAFPVKPGGWHLPNVDVSEDALQMVSTPEAAALRGRTRTRIWPTARERLAHDPTFKPDTNIRRLVWAQDESLSGASAKQTFLAGLAGKNRLEVLQETHPQLAAKMLGLRKRLQSLRGSAGRLDENLDSAVQDFLASPVEDIDLTALRAGLDVKLKRGPRTGMDIAAIQKEIEGTKAQIKALQPGWKVANLKPYVFVQEGVFRYFPVEEAKQLQQLLEVSRNPLLSFMENVRNFAFNFDLSPITGVQVPLGFFADPYGTGKQFGRWLITSRENPFSIGAFTEEVAANPQSWQEFAFVTGRPISAAVPAEFAGGWLKRIPGYQKVNESMFLLPTRMTKRMFDEAVSSLEKAGFTHEQAIVAAGDQVTKAVPLWNPSLLGLSAAREKLLRGVTISPSFLLRPPQLISEAVQGYVKMGLFQTLTPKQRLAVRLMTGLIGTVEGIAVMSNVYRAKQEGKDTEQALRDALTLDHPAFMALTLPDGSRINLGGPFRSFLRMVAPRMVPGSPVPIPFWGIGNWALSRATPLARTQLDLFRNKDFYGRRIVKGEFPENILRGIAYEFEGVAPLIGRPVPEALRTGEPLEKAAVETATQAAGITYIPFRPIYELRRQWRGDFEAYNELPTTTTEARAKNTLTRENYRKRNPEIDAKLFVAGDTESLMGDAAFIHAVRLMKENKLKIADIRGLEVQEFEGRERTNLRRRFEQALGLPISQRPGPVSPVGPSYRVPQAPSRKAPPLSPVGPMRGPPVPARGTQGAAQFKW